MNAAESLELLANACTGYLRAREHLRAAPEGSDEERYALASAVSALQIVRDRTDGAIQLLATRKVGGGT